MIDPTLPIPSPVDAEQAALAQGEVLELMDRLTREGLNWRAVLAGAATASANVVTGNLGAAEVPVYFARLSAMTMHFAD